MNKSKILGRRIICNKYGKKFVKEIIEVGDGSKIDWYYLDSPKSIIIIPITSSNKLVTVKLYRYNLKKHVRELPAGNFEDKSSILIEAKRELLEETGYLAKKYINLGKYYVLPSETNRWVHYVLALDVKKAGPPFLDNLIEKHFDISTKEINFNDIVSTIGKSKSAINGVEHILGIILANNYLKNRRINK